MKSPIKYNEGDMKPCWMCGETKPVSEFRQMKSSTRSDGSHPYSSECKKCHNTQNKERSKRQPNAYRERRKNYLASEKGRVQSAKRWAKYVGSKLNLTEEEYRALLAEQGGLCAICRERPAKAIDHDHKTLKVRGLLCTQCNMGIGLLGENESLLKRAIHYLQGKK